MALNTDSTNFLTVRRLWSIMSSFKDKIVTALGGKSDKSSTVSNVAWSSSKLTKTINGTTTDVVSASTLKSAMSLNNVTNDAQVKRYEMGTANGVATLDANGIINTSQLPSYVDDVLEYSAKSQFPATGETGKIYVDTSTNLTWRWSGTTYVEISPSLALGETSSTAYRGDRGKTAYDHSQVTSGNPHNVTATDVKAVSYDTNSQGLTDTQKGNARTNIGAGTSNLALGTSSTTAAKGDHTHTTSIASDSSSGTVVTLAHDTQYKLTAGGTSVLFKTPDVSSLDTKVTQTKDDSGTTAYPLLMAGATDPNGSATTARYDSGVKLTPSTNTISANISGNASTATKINTSTKIGDVDLPVYVAAGGVVTPIGHSLHLPTDGTESEVRVGTDSNNYAYLDATPASGSNKRGVWTVTDGNGSWLAYSDSDGNAHIGYDSSVSITNATGWRSTTKCYVGGIPVNGYTYSNSSTAHTIFYIGKMFGTAYEPTTNDIKNFTALLTVSTLANLGNNVENRGSGFTAIIQINARQATERHATINVIADDNWPVDHIPTIVCNTEDVDGKTLYRYGICFMDGSDALKSFTYTKFDIASLCECRNWNADRWFSATSKLNTMTFFGGERKLIIRDRRPGVTYKNAYLSVRNSDDIFANLEAWDNSGDVKCGIYAKNGGVANFICYKDSDGTNYFNGMASYTENARRVNIENYLKIEIKRGNNHRNASITIFGGSGSYPFIANIGFQYLTSPGDGESAGFQTPPVLSMVECNNLSSNAYVPNVWYINNGSSGSSYIYCKWSGNRRLTVLLNTYAPGAIALSDVSSLPSEAVAAGNGHSLPHMPGIGTQVGSSSLPVYVTSGGELSAVTASSTANNLLSSLPTSWTAVPTDDTYFIRRDTGGSATFGQVKASTILSYIDGKRHFACDPASVSTATKRIQLGYGLYDSSGVGYCCYLVHVFFNYVDNTLKGVGATLLVNYDWRTNSFQKSKCVILNDNGLRAAGYNIVLANFLTTSSDVQNLHVTIGLVQNTAPSTLVSFSYSYCKIFFVGSDLNWTPSVTSDTVGSYDFLVPAEFEKADYAFTAENASTAAMASKLSTNAGSANQPVYFSNGVPVACNWWVS